MKTLDIPETGTHRFVYRHGYKKKDVETLARILFEPNKYALRAAQKVFKSINKDKINFTEGKLGFPRTYFPFKGTTQLQLYGRRLKTASGFIFFVSEIRQCTGRFPFRKLSCIDEIAKGGRPAPEDAKEMFPGSSTHHHGPAHDGDGGTSVSDQKPDYHATRIDVELGSRIFTDLSNTSIKFVKTRDSTYKSGYRASKYQDELINASTGQGTSGKSNAAPQSLTKRNLSPSKVAPDLDTFLQVVESLKTMSPERKIKTIGIGRCYQDKNKIWYSYFPEVWCKSRPVLRKFSFLNHEKTVLKSFIAIEINVNKQYLYLFEAQRRLKVPPPPIEQSPYMESLPILLLYKTGYSQCKEPDFIDMLVKTVARETWPEQSKLSGFIRDVIYHGRGVQTTEDMAARINKKITNNI